MNISRIFQKLIALVAVVAISFGFAAPSASAAETYSAPTGATTNANYFVGTEVGITVYNESTGQTVLWCNNKYGQGAGGEWNSTCESRSVLQPSERYLLQGFTKTSTPNGNVCWKLVDVYNIQVPSPIPGSNRYLTTLISAQGNYLGQITLDGRNLLYHGQQPANPKQFPNGGIC